MASHQPWYVGQTSPAWKIPLTAGGSPDDLTNVDITKFSLTFRSNASPPVDTTGTGTFTVYTLFPAAVLYKPSVADVASAFSGTLFVKALFPPSGTTADQVVYDPIPFVITAS